jgi:hypothetical protein
MAFLPVSSKRLCMASDSWRMAKHEIRETKTA